jgi:hypothetical protein
MCSVIYWTGAGFYDIWLATADRVVLRKTTSGFAPGVTVAPCRDIASGIVRAEDLVRFDIVFLMKRDGSWHAYAGRQAAALASNEAITIDA